MSPRRSTSRKPIDAATRRCLDHGFELTEPRRVILETMLSLQGTHPTADEVHEATLRGHPGIGRATVYRALESFVRIGVLTKAAHTGTAVRYDAVVERHHHLVCLACDEIIDISDDRLDAVPVPDTSKSGFRVSDLQVQLRGLCRACQKKEEGS